MEDLSGPNFYLTALLALLTFLGPFFAVLPVRIIRQFERVPGGWAVVGVGGFGFIACSISWFASMNPDPTWFDAFLINILAPILSLISLILLTLGAQSIGGMASMGTPWWIRIISFFSMLVAIPMSYAPIAELIDGEFGLDSVMNYYTEYVWRLFDMLSGGYISSFDRAGYSTFVNRTAENSYSAVLFNLVVGSFVLGAVYRLGIPKIAGRKELSR